MISKRQIAMEWLYLLGGMIFGFVVAPLAVFLVFSLLMNDTATFAEYYPRFFAALVNGPDRLFAWVVVLGPYVLFQLIRSVLWAWKTARST